MALAERLETRLYIVQPSRGEAPADSDTHRLDETLAELINSARQAGLSISHHLANGDLQNEVVDFIREEGIDLLVFSADDRPWARALMRVKPRVSLPIIQVREKDHVEYL
jgi:hypothetical protein